MQPEGRLDIVQCYHTRPQVVLLSHSYDNMPAAMLGGSLGVFLKDGVCFTDWQECYTIFKGSWWYPLAPRRLIVEGNCVD